MSKENLNIQEGVKIIRIDSNPCVGCGICEKECPMGFASRNDKAVVLNPDVPYIEKAISSCPVGAIQSDDINLKEKFRQGIFNLGQRSDIGIAEGRSMDMRIRWDRGRGRRQGRGFREKRGGGRWGRGRKI